MFRSNAFATVSGTSNESEEPPYEPLPLKKGHRRKKAKQNSGRSSTNFQKQKPRKLPDVVSFCEIFEASTLQATFAILSILGNLSNPDFTKKKNFATIANFRPQCSMYRSRRLSKSAALFPQLIRAHFRFGLAPRKGFSSSNHRDGMIKCDLVKLLLSIDRSCRYLFFFLWG